MRVFSVLIVLAVFVSGCSNADEFQETVELSPILSEAVTVELGAARVREELAQLSIEVEELTATCMKERGFDYVPRMAATEAAPAVGLDSDASFLETYGFGVSTRWFAKEQVGELAGYQAGVKLGGTDDPNFAIVGGLSDLERDAYFVALNGSELLESTNPSDAEIKEFAERSDGCAFEAQRQPTAGQPFLTFLRDFDTELQELADRVNAHPEVVAFEERVSKCVAEKGLEWTDLGTFTADSEEQLRQIELEALAAGPIDPEADLGGFSLVVVSGEQLERLAQLQRDEIALAVVVEDCGGGPKARSAAVAELRASLAAEIFDSTEAVNGEVAD